MEMLRQTPFGVLIEAMRSDGIDRIKFRKRDDDIELFIRLFNPQTNRFELKEDYFYLKPIDIRLIFGLVDGKKKLDIGQRCPKGNSNFVIRIFGDEPKISRARILSELRRVLRNTGRDDYDDVVRLTVLLLLVSIFVPNMQHSLGWIYASCVEKVNMIKRYDWSDHICRTLLASLKKKCLEPRHVIGCTIALPVSIS